MNKKVKIFLKELDTKDVSTDYISWLKDKEVLKYTDQRFLIHTKKKVLKFVKLMKKSKKNFLYGIFDSHLNKHIGNIKLGPINFFHKYASISYLIGNKYYWNKGVATQAIREIVSLAKKKYKLKKLIAGVYSPNKSSAIVLKKCKFKLEGISIKRLTLSNKKRVDLYLFGRNI